MTRQSMRVASMLAALFAASQVRAEDTAKLDAEFLEFLGSLDSDDEVWTEFLDVADLPKADEAKAEPAPAPESTKVKDHEP